MDKDQIKKTPNANIESQKATAILMGVVLAISILFFAFEWTSGTRKLDKSIIPQDVIAEEEIEITRREETPPPPPPPPPKIEEPEEINVVDEKVETKMDIRTEDDQSQRQQEVYTPPPPPKPIVDEEAEKIFEVVEHAPEFPGGYTAMMKFLNDNIQYPVIAAENGIQGRVVCQFVVERDGSITDVVVARGEDVNLDKEAVRVIKSMPRWTPGKQRGKPVRVRFTLPVLFRLEN